jgi:hypothetical protein
MLNKTLKKKEQIIEFISDHETTLGPDNSLTADDWDFLYKAHQFLQPFAGATLYAEGDTASLTSSLMLMDVLLRHYEQQKVY